MRDFLAILLLSLVAAAPPGLAARPQSTPPQLIQGGIVHSRPAPGTEPRMQLERQYYDFGEIDAGRVSHAEITFRNEGKGPLRILKVRGLCSCVAGAILVDGKNYNLADPISPGSSGKIQFSLDAVWVTGEKHTRLDLLTNDPAFGPTTDAPFGHVEISLAARIRKTLEWLDAKGTPLPESRVELGGATSDTKREFECQLRHARNELFELSGIVPGDDPNVQFTFAPEGGASPASVWRIRGTVAPGMAFGKFVKRFQIVTKPEIPGVHLFVDGEVRGHVGVEPPMPGGLRMGMVRPAQTPAGKLTFQSFPGAPAPLKLLNPRFQQITDFQIVNGLFVAKTPGAPRTVDRKLGDYLSADIRETEAGRKAEIQITIRPGATPGAFSFMLVVETSVPGGPETLAIPVTGLIR